MTLRLPLNTLWFFEAVARHESFTFAAQELEVTQSAVSKQVKKLEESLDTILFTRNSLYVRLTDEGNLLYKSVGPMLARFEAVAQTLSKPPLHG